MTGATPVMQPPMATPSAYVIVNHATGIDDASVNELAAAFTQRDKTLAVYWGIQPMQFVASRTITPTQWPIFLLDNSDQEGALGYHEANGRIPYGRVFVADCKKDGVSWTVDASHEACEMRLDPWADLAAVPGNTGVGYELCDPVQDDSDGIQVGGVAVSDFVTPGWFVPSIGGPVDADGKLTKPLTIAPGGYCPILKNGKWGQIMRRTTPGGTCSVRALRSHRILMRTPTVTFTHETDNEDAILMDEITTNA